MSAYQVIEWLIVGGAVVASAAYALRMIRPKPKVEAKGCGSCSSGSSCEAKPPGK